MSFTNNIFFNFKDITSVPLNGMDVTVKPLIFPIVSGSKTLLNFQVSPETDLTGSIYLSNVVLPNLFKIDVLNNKKKVTYYANVPTASNDNLPFNASTYIISASIDNGNPTTVVFDLDNIIPQAFSVNKVRISPASLYIPNINSGSIVPGDFKEFFINGNGSFTAPSMVPGQYIVQCYSNQPRDIVPFVILVPANSGSLNVNQIIIPDVNNQVNISIPFANAPGQGMTIDQMFDTFQTIITSGSFFNITTEQSLGADFAIIAGNTIYTASYAISASVALFAPFQSGSLFASSSVSASYADFAVTASSASYAQNSSTSISASYGFASTSASYAHLSDTASLAIIALSSNTASIALLSQTASFTVSASNALTASTALVVGTALTAISASISLTASYVSASNIVGAINSTSASNALSASYAATASFFLGAVASTASYAFTSSVANIALVANDISHSGAVNNNLPKWLNGLLTNSSSINDDGTTVTLSASMIAPQVKVIQQAGQVPFSVNNAAPWFNPVFAVKVPDNVNPELFLAANNSASFIQMIPTGSVIFANAGNVIVYNTLTASIVQASQLIGTLFGTASNATTSSFALTASISLNAPLSATASFAITASALPARTQVVDPTLVWDADVNGNVVGLALYPSKGVEFFWQSASMDPPVLIMRTIGSQSVWQGIQSFVSASGYWLGTASFAQVAGITNVSTTTISASHAYGSFTISTGSNDGAYLYLSASGLGGIVASMHVNPSGIVFDHKILGQDCQMSHFIGDGSQITGVISDSSSFAYSASIADNIPDNTTLSRPNLSNSVAIGGFSIDGINTNGVKGAVLYIDQFSEVLGSTMTLADAQNAANNPYNVSASFTSIISGSGAFSASYAKTSTSASNALTSSFVLGSISSATFANSASFASRSISSSVSNTASYAFGVQITDIGNPSNDFPIVFKSGSNFLVTNGGSTSLFSINPGTATIASSIFLGDLTGTSSFAVSASLVISSSYARFASTASAITFIPATSSFARTASFAVNSATASISLQSGTASFVAGVNVSGSVALAQLAALADYSTFAGIANTASYFNGNSAFSISSSYALTCSFALNGGGGGGSSVSSSWASSSYTASYLNSAAGVTGYFPFYSNNTLTTASVLHSDGTFLYLDTLLYGTASAAISSIFAISSSYSHATDASVSASYAVTASTLTWMATSSSLNPHTAAIIVLDSSTGSYSSAFYNYTVTSASIQRAGLVMATFDSLGDVDWTDNATPDLNGSTADMVLSVHISESHVRLVSDANIYNWNVKAIASYL